MKSQVHDVMHVQVIQIRLNKRPMGQIAHLRNQTHFRRYMINKLYQIMEYERKKPIIFFLKIEWSLFVKP